MGLMEYVEIATKIILEKMGKEVKMGLIKKVLNLFNKLEIPKLQFKELHKPRGIVLVLKKTQVNQMLKQYSSKDICAFIFTKKKGIFLNIYPK